MVEESVILNFGTKGGSETVNTVNQIDKSLRRLSNASNVFSESQPKLKPAASFLYSISDAIDLTTQKYGIMSSDAVDGFLKQANAGKFVDDSNRKVIKSSDVYKNVLKGLSKEQNRFKMEALGLLFGGMAIERTFGRITKAGFDLFGITELLNETMGIVMLPIMDLLGPVIFDIADAFMNMDDSQKLLIGSVMLLGQALGGALSGLGQAILFINSLEQIGGLTGLFANLKDIFVSIGTWAGKTLTTTWDWITSLDDKGSIFLDFFDKTGKWILSKLVTLWDWTTSIADTIWKFISDAGQWLWSKVETVISFVADALSTAFKLISAAGTWLVDKVETVVNFAIDTASAVLKWFSEKGTWLLDKATSAINLTIDAASAAATTLLTWLKSGPTTKIGINFDLSQATAAITAFGSAISTALAPIIGIGGGLIGAFLTAGGLIPADISNAEWEKKIRAAGWSEADIRASLAYRRSQGHMAEGGIVTRPINALIGEAGPEAIIPLDRANGFGNMTNNINIYNPIMDNTGRVDELARKVADYIGSDYRRLTYR